jgi:hypothetical protein
MPDNTNSTGRCKYPRIKSVLKFHSWIKYNWKRVSDTNETSRITIQLKTASNRLSGLGRGEKQSLPGVLADISFHLGELQQL